MKYLPSPRILAFFVIVLGLLGLGWFWYFSPSITGEKEVYIKPGFATSQGFGAKDWESVLKETIKGAEGLRVESPTGQTPNFTDQLTQALSNTLGPRLLSGETVSLEEISQIQNYLPQPETILGEILEVRADELKISEANDSASVKNYFNQVYAVYEKNFLPLEKDDLAILAEALAKDNFSELQKIDEVILAFDRSIQEVKKIPVPKGWKNFAVREVNYLLRSKRLVQLIRNVENDPLSALVAFSLRVNLMNEIKNFTNETGKLLSEKGISFSPDEGGYKFFQ